MEKIRAYSPFFVEIIREPIDGYKHILEAIKTKAVEVVMDETEKYLKLAFDKFYFKHNSCL